MSSVSAARAIQFAQDRLGDVADLRRLGSSVTFA
jgi:hypothetical protein